MKKQLFAGKFEIQGEISKGQTGTIYYGYDLGLRQEVAIKVYHSHINGRLIRGKTFIEKSKPLLLIDHPNLTELTTREEITTYRQFMQAIAKVIHKRTIEQTIPGILRKEYSGKELRNRAKLVEKAGERANASRACTGGSK